MRDKNLRDEPNESEAEPLARNLFQILGITQEIVFPQ
tara:strand:+ start:420 stop:530 length:111 start_codon:yes stop_codon:yes gene_type:complete